MEKSRIVSNGKLNLIMKEQRLTVGDLVELSGISRNTITRARQGKTVSLSTAYIIAEALDLEINEVWETRNDAVREDIIRIDKEIKEHKRDIKKLRNERAKLCRQLEERG